MAKVLKKYLMWAALGAVLYFFLSYHIIFFEVSSTPRLLKKSELTLKYTFFSTKGKKARNIMAVDELRWDGIGELLVEEGLMTEAELEKILRQYDD